MYVCKYTLCKYVHTYTSTMHAVYTKLDTKNSHVQVVRLSSAQASPCGCPSRTVASVSSLSVVHTQGGQQSHLALQLHVAELQSSLWECVPLHQGCCLFCLAGGDLSRQQQSLSLHTKDLHFCYSMKFSACCLSSCCPCVLYCTACTYVRMYVCMCE